MKKVKQNKSKAPKNAPYSKEVTVAPVAKDVRVQTYLRVLPGRKGYPGSMRLQGCDLLQVVRVPGSSIPGGETAGATYAEVYVNPSSFSGTRLSRFSALYEKYLFTKMKLIFQPCKSSMQDGSVGLAYDRDIDDPTPPGTVQGLRQFCAWYGTKIGRVWDRIELDAKLISPETGFYCDDHGAEDRTAYQGQFYCFCEVPTGLAADAQIGDLFLEYDLDLFIPSLDSEVPTSAYSNAGGTSTTASDIFRPGAAGLAGATRDPLNDQDIYPAYGLNSSGISQLFLDEGVHRMVLRAVQNGAGTLNLQPGPGPTMTPREPASAYGAQPLWQSIINSASNAAGNSAYVDWLFNIPKGGVDITCAPLLNVTSGQWNMNLVRMGEVMAPNAFAQLAQSLVA